MNYNCQYINAIKSGKLLYLAEK